MPSSEMTEIYSGFTEYLMPFSYFVALVLVAMPLAAFIGFYLGDVEHKRRGYHNISADKIPGGTSLGAMLALLGLILGFAFSSALNWREARQTALVEEAMAISTAFLTVDLLEDPARTELKERLLTYARTRLITSENVQSMEALTDFLTRSMEAQANIWPAAMQALDEDVSAPIRTAVAARITEMLDAHTKRLAAAALNIPPPVKLTVFMVALAAIFIVGNRSALQGRDLTWRTFVFAGVLAVVMIVIFDIDRTFEGTMRIDQTQLRVTIQDMQTALASATE